VLGSIAIHTILLISNQMSWGEAAGGSSTLQVYISEGNDEPQQNSAVNHPLDDKPDPVTETASQLTQTITNRDGVQHIATATPIQSATVAEVKLREPTERQPQRIVKAAAKEVRSSQQETAPSNEAAEHSVADNNRTIREQNELSQLMQLALARHFRYPFQALRRGLEGEVIVAFTLKVDGQIENIRIASSSGYSILDSAALQTLNKVSRIERTLDHAYSFKLPVIYQLQDS